MEKPSYFKNDPSNSSCNILVFKVADQKIFDHLYNYYNVWESFYPFKYGMQIDGRKH